MPYVHHTVLHFPISFGILAAALALLSVNGNERWGQLYRITTYLAAVTVVLAAASGLLAAPHAIGGGLAKGNVASHRNLGLAGGVLLVLSTWLAWRAHRRKSVVLIRVAAAVSVLAAVVVSAGAHVGGDMLHPGLAPWSKEKHMHGLVDKSSLNCGCAERILHTVSNAPRNGPTAGCARTRLTPSEARPIEDLACASFGLQPVVGPACCGAKKMVAVRRLLRESLRARMILHLADADWRALRRRASGSQGPCRSAVAAAQESRPDWRPCDADCPGRRPRIPRKSGLRI